MLPSPKSSLKGAFLVAALSLVSALTLGLAPGAFAQKAPAVSQTQMLPAVPLPMSRPQARYFAAHPAEWQRWYNLMARPRVHVTPGNTTLTTPPTPPPFWQGLTHIYPGDSLGAAELSLLTDGSVMVHDGCGQNWYRLTPDNTGSYVNGTWSPAIPLPAGYAPLDFASEVLPDGRLIINGGEYNNPGSGCPPLGVWTNLGAIYDPAANSWTAVPAPGYFSEIGDAESVVLPNGTYMLADCCASPPVAALLTNPTSFIWTQTGMGKSNSYDEEGWTLLPTGNVLTVDAYVSDFPNPCVAPNNMNTEIYTPSSGSWTSAGNTPTQLSDCSGTAEGGPSYEMGPVVMRPDGLALAFGATVQTPATTAFYNPTTGVWSAGPNLTYNSINYNLGDAPAAVEPSGNILYAANAGLFGFGSPTQFFEVSYPGNTIGTVPNTPNAPNDPAYAMNLLVLPTGQILQTARSNDIEIYTPAGTFISSWQPIITSVPTTLAPGMTYQIAGTQLNGLSQGAYYGDDQQYNTNYPLVRITNNGTGHVFYAKTAASARRRSSRARLRRRTSRCRPLSNLAPACLSPLPMASHRLR